MTMWEPCILEPCLIINFMISTFPARTAPTSVLAPWDVEMLKLLLKRGATTKDNSALAKAARSGSLEAVQLLVERGFYFSERSH